MTRFVFIFIVAFLPVAASADSCPGNPQALGTERVMEVNARVTPRVGRKHFPSTLARNAAAHPQLARRALAEGHTLGHHSFSHPLLSRMALPRAEADIGRGIAADETAIYGSRRPSLATPFFRFPGFASNRALLDRLAARGIVVFGADVWASDWLSMSPDQELRLILSRIERTGHGIVLFHDTKAQTARMLPAFLRELKRRGFRVVHVVPENAGG